jgi:hypothetical protein
MTIQEAVNILDAFIGNRHTTFRFEAWQTLKTAVLAQQTNNSRVMQLPTLEEVLKHVYCGPNRDSSHTASVVSSAYDFIVSRQQS